MHFGRGPQRKLRIIRKPGQRTCEDCVQEQRESKEKDKNQKRYHCWAVVEWNFKSDLIFYEMLSNSNRKISQRVYIDSILEPAVKTWLNDGHDFVLKEDEDSGHESGKDNIVRRWKNKHRLKHYFNCPHSPDISHWKLLTGGQTDGGSSTSLGWRYYRYSDQRRMGSIVSA
jgi:hypothetical protein